MRISALLIISVIASTEASKCNSRDMNVLSQNVFTAIACVASPVNRKSHLRTCFQRNAPPISGGCITCMYDAMIAYQQIRSDETAASYFAFESQIRDCAPRQAEEIDAPVSTGIVWMKSTDIMDFSIACILLLAAAF